MNGTHAGDNDQRYNYPPPVDVENSRTVVSFSTLLKVGSVLVILVSAYIWRDVEIRDIRAQANVTREQTAKTDSQYVELSKEVASVRQDVRHVREIVEMLREEIRANRRQ